MSETETPEKVINPANKLIEKLKNQGSSSPEEALCCANCLHPVTRENLKIEIQNKHLHLLVNPYGHKFQVRCFSEALGCISQGDLIDADSWFPGFYWRFALCAECQLQLGWHYLCDDGTYFYGLIAEKLILNLPE